MDTTRLRVKEEPNLFLAGKLGNSFFHHIFGDGRQTKEKKKAYIGLAKDNKLDNLKI